MDNPKVTILWDFPIRTGRTVQANRQDIVIKHKQNKTCQLIDMSVPSDSNISAKVVLGMIKKGKQKYINEIPGNLSLAEILKFKK